MVSPSITGSENGMPISMASAPAAAMARTTSSHPEPRPPLTYGTRSLQPASRRARRCDSRLIPARSRPSQLLAGEALGDLGGVLVAPAREGHQHGGAARHRTAGLAGQPAEGVRGLERWHDALGDREQLEPGDGLV